MQTCVYMNKALDPQISVLSSPHPIKSEGISLNVKAFYMHIGWNFANKAEVYFPRNVPVKYSTR